jgi:glycogen debranching enzyme
VTASTPKPDPARPASQRTLPPRLRPIARANDLGSTAVLRHGALTLVADPFGDIHPDSRGLGLYLGDTRVLSGLALLVDGRRPTLLAADPGGSDRGSVQMTNPELRNDPSRAEGGARLATQSIGVRRERTLDPNGLHERVHVTNFTLVRLGLELCLLLDCDAADIFEVRGYARDGRGGHADVEVDGSVVRFAYHGRDGRRLDTSVAFDVEPARVADAPPDRDATVAAFWDIEADPGESVTLGWSVASGWTPRRPRGLRLEPRRPVPGRGAPPRTRFESDDELLNAVLARSLADVALLETVGPGPGESFLAAGVPWFATLFGRDALISALFLLPAQPSIAVDTLRTLARLQASERVDAEDAEPGKILHELRTGEMAAAGEVPFARYYGSADATPLWLLLLAEHHAWAADDRLLDELWPNALRGLAWLEAQVADGGLVTYETRAPRGLRNQGWKDSADSVRDRHGTVAEPPIALIEVQAYAVGAFRAMARLAGRRGDLELSARLRGRADALVEVLETRFWSPDLERYAMALDGSGRPADAMASNVAHALWQGALREDRAASVARELAGQRMASGWGVRTYAAGQPGYNPLGYHLGTVWPHDTAIAVAGLRRYGFSGEAAQLANGLLDAARTFPMFRMPEVFCGFPRAETGHPVAYPVACAPQAFAATAPFFLLQALLGIEADAPSRTLRILRPVLPQPVRRLVVAGLRVGDAEVDLLFQSWRGTVGAEVLRRRGDVSVHVEL